MNKEGWTEGGVLNKDLSIYEDRKEGRRGSEKTIKGKDWFGSLVCVCVLEQRKTGGRCGIVGMG